MRVLCKSILAPFSENGGENIFQFRGYVRIALLFSFSLILFESWGQQTVNQDYTDYINRYRNIAVKEMLTYHIPASIILAQGIIESSCGKSPLATEANNHFGIKCHQDWTGERYFYDDDAKQECFRKYTTAEESYRDHSLFLADRKRYAALFSLDLEDYTGWAMGLKQAGYATNPDYPNILIRMIQANRLDLLDQIRNLGDTIKEEPAVSEFVTPAPLLKDEYCANGRLKFRKEYQMPSPSGFTVLRTSNSGRAVYENNGIPFIFAQKEDTWFTIAREFGIFSSQVYQDNDLSQSDSLRTGQIVYLEPKKGFNRTKTITVKQGDTLYSISQEYGVKLKQLIRENSLEPLREPAIGETLRLGKAGFLGL